MKLWKKLWESVGGEGEMNHLSVYHSIRSILHVRERCAPKIIKNRLHMAYTVPRRKQKLDWGSGVRQKEREKEIQRNSASVAHHESRNKIDKMATKIVVDEIISLLQMCCSLSFIVSPKYTLAKRLQFSFILLFCRFYWNFCILPCKSENIAARVQKWMGLSVQQQKPTTAPNMRNKSNWKFKEIYMYVCIECI